MHTHTRPFVIAALAAVLTIGTLAQELTLPNQKDSLKFAVIGDSGTGNTDQYRLAKQFATVRERSRLPDSLQDFRRRANHRRTRRSPQTGDCGATKSTRCDE